MKDFFATLIKRINKISPLPILVFSLCSVVICSMMYMKMAENNRLLLELLAQGGVVETIQPSDTPLSAPAGSTVTILVSAEQVEDMYGYQFKLNYDESAMEYKSIRSSLDDITTIFQKPFDGYLLVGATMIGEREGLTAQDTPVCEIVMTVKGDGPVSEVSVSEINIVDSSLSYDEGATGWSCEVVT